MALALVWTGPTAAERAVPEPGYSLVPASVIGVDDRRAPAADDDLVRAVGVVFCSRPGEPRGRSSRATGTLVGSRRTVLTAAHVFTDESRAGRPPVEFDALDDCRFQQFDAAGALVVDVRFSQVAYGAYRRDAGLPTEDWAVLRTRELLPEPSRPLSFAALSLDDLANGTRFPIAVLGVHRSSANYGEYNLAVPVAGALERALRGLASGQIDEPRLRMARNDAQGLSLLALRQWTRAR